METDTGSPPPHCIVTMISALIYDDPTAIDVPDSNNVYKRLSMAKAKEIANLGDKADGIPLLLKHEGPSVGHINRFYIGRHLYSSDADLDTYDHTDENPKYVHALFAEAIIDNISFLKALSDVSAHYYKSTKKPYVFFDGFANINHNTDTMPGSNIHVTVHNALVKFYPGCSQLNRVASDERHMDVLEVSLCKAGAREGTIVKDVMFYDSKDKPLISLGVADISSAEYTDFVLKMAVLWTVAKDPARDQVLKHIQQMHHSDLYIKNAYPQDSQSSVDVQPLTESGKNITHQGADSTSTSVSTLPNMAATTQPKVGDIVTEVLDTLFKKPVNSPPLQAVSHAMEECQHGQCASHSYGNAHRKRSHTEAFNGCDAHMFEPRSQNGLWHSRMDNQGMPDFMDTGDVYRNMKYNASIPNRAYQHEQYAQFQEFMRLQEMARGEQRRDSNRHQVVEHAMDVSLGRYPVSSVTTQDSSRMKRAMIVADIMNAMAASESGLSQTQTQPPTENIATGQLAQNYTRQAPAEYLITQQQQQFQQPVAVHNPPPHVAIQHTPSPTYIHTQAPSAPAPQEKPMQYMLSDTQFKQLLQPTKTDVEQHVEEAHVPNVPTASSIPTHPVAAPAQAAESPGTVPLAPAEPVGQNEHVAVPPVSTETTAVTAPNIGVDDSETAAHSMDIGVGQKMNPVALFRKQLEVLTG